jgi:hypothetical protein
MKFLMIVLTVVCLTGCASNPWSRQWATKGRIEQTLQEKLPIGTSREAILEFFKKENIHVSELPPMSKKPEHTLTVRFVVSWLRVPQTAVIVSFYLGPDGKSIKMTSSESLAGFL